MEGTRMAELQDALELEQLPVFILPHETQFSTTSVIFLGQCRALKWGLQKEVEERLQMQYWIWPQG